MSHLQALAFLAMLGSYHHPGSWLPVIALALVALDMVTDAYDARRAKDPHP